MLNAITVCVNYVDYLKLTINNRYLFDRWIIVTSCDDHDTLSFCKANNLECVITERIYESGPFCKGKAINDGLLHLNHPDWVCVVDADTYLFTEVLKGIIDSTVLDKDAIYGLFGRVQVENERELTELFKKGKILESDIEDVNMLVGFFQMWHRSKTPFYPEESHNAGLDDVLMLDYFASNKKHIFPSYAIHIGPKWVNHNGVKNACT